MGGLQVRLTERTQLGQMKKLVSPQARSYTATCPFRLADPFGDAMPRRSQKFWTATLFVTTAGLVAVAAALLSDDHNNTRPFPVVGDWHVADPSGRSRGTITFLPGGAIDSYDDYSGRWSYVEAGVAVKFWRTKPTSLMGYLHPQTEKYEFTPQFDSMNNVVTLRGKNVTLRSPGAAQRFAK